MANVNYPRGRSRVASAPLPVIPTPELFHLEPPPDKKARAKSIHYEQAEQITYFDQVRACCDPNTGQAKPHRPFANCIAALANENAAGEKMGVIRKRMGVMAGLPDLGVFAPGRLHGVDYPGLFIEMKREDGVASDVRDSQRDWHERLSASGYLVIVAFGWRRAWAITCEYLGWEENTCRRS